MPRSEAQKRADKKYQAKTYKRVAVNVRLDYFPRIDEYMKNHNIESSSAFFNCAAKYIIDNNIDMDKPVRPRLRGAGLVIDPNCEEVSIKGDGTVIIGMKDKNNN